MFSIIMLSIIIDYQFDVIDNWVLNSFNKRTKSSNYPLHYDIDYNYLEKREAIDTGVFDNYAIDNNR